MDPFYKLYTECFPEDSELCADVVMKKLILSQRLAVFEKNKLRSALYLVDKSLRYGDKRAKIKHIVALGTFVEARRKGYAERLIFEAINTCDAPFITLYPFSHAFYKKYGFETVSFDFEEPEQKGQRASCEQAKSIYDGFCEGLDYCFERSEEDFRFFEEVFAADGESFTAVEGGLMSPDGYIPKDYTLTAKEGVMARICDVKKALALTGVTTDVRIRLRDEIAAKNNFSFRLKGGEIIRCDGFDIEVSVAELTKAVFGKSQALENIFPPKQGYLADKY